MKRGKRFLENENLLIYVGTVIFFILAIALGIIMYMMTRTSTKMENGSEQISQQAQISEVTESVTSDMGKTVEEQESNATTETNQSNLDETEGISTNEENTTSLNKVTQTNTEPKQEPKTETPDEPDTTAKTEANAPVEDKVTETKKETTFIKPTEGEIICEYAKDNLIYSETLKEWVTHMAIDIKADKTSVIKSAAEGNVKSIVNDPRYGLTIVISHDEGYETVYSNLLTAEFVVEGEEVTQGQTIGTVGNTAAFESSMECHLHFELLKDGEYLDPTIYLK